MIWQLRLSFIVSIIVAKVVDFPLPVGPVTRISPFSLVVKRFKISGRWSSS